MLMWPVCGFVFLVYNLKSSESIRWPAGQYGLPKPVSGCPKSVGFQWKEGWLSQDTNGDISNNSKSKEFHLDGVVDDKKVNRSFCTKWSGTGNQGRPTWPTGLYCIYKSGKCPSNDLNGGLVQWDDDNTENANARGGTLPYGVKKVGQHDTEIRFCCRTDGYKSRPILLPSETPFFLLAYETPKCQMVKWAVTSLEWIHYDTEHNNNADNATGAFPYDGGQRHPTIYYCYYRSCNETLTGVYGTFHSPNHPKHYPDGQYCSWRITVRPGQQIHLKFTNFSLQDAASTDVLEIYDGENETGISLGMFYGLKPPPKEGINSSSNHMFLIFKSDDTISYIGFSAFYREGKFFESIRWPAGQYGLPKPVSGCPKSVGFQWKEGWLSQDTNGDISNNSKSKEFHLDGVVDDKVNRSFCTKRSGTGNQGRPTWPIGRYCIYKSDDCPLGLTEGMVHWDDEDTSNANTRGGTLPYGVKQDEYSNTEISFCCRTDGNKSRPILLPSETPFFLLAYETAKCQMVKWAVTSLEWIHYDTEHNRNADRARGAFPYDGGQQHPTIYYCFYRSCNETLTGANGTFHSPNHPKHYPDGQYCSWRITVRPGQQIHLKFTNFSLQDAASTDVLEIYDGVNETGISLGMFYGLKPPPKEGINSFSNHMFLIFKSDDTISYTGFSAFYREGKFLDETTSTTMATQTPEITSSPSVTPKSLLTLEKTSPTTDGPSDASGGKDKSKQSREKGFDVVAVVVPVVLLVFVVSLLVAVLFYCKRRKTKKDEDQGVPNEVVYARPYEETPMSVENVCYERTTGEAQMSVDNPCYDRTTGELPMSADNPCYDRGVYSGLTIANRGCTTEENDLYTEINEMDSVGEKDVFDEQRTQNPTFSTHGDAVFNPIYDVSSM